MLAIKCMFCLFFKDHCINENYNKCFIKSNQITVLSFLILRTWCILHTEESVGYNISLYYELSLI